MTEPIIGSREVINDNWRSTCPFCASQKIYYLGSISYSSPILYSTTSIVTSKVPELWACRHCQSRFTENAVTEQVAVELYSTGKSLERWQPVEFTQHQCSEVVEEMKRILHPNNFVIDVGCNTGEFLDFALLKGCKTGGVELSDDSRIILKNKGHKTFSELEAIEDCSVDVITAFDLVEHLYNPAKFLSACKSKLKPSGRLCILTGNPLCTGARLSSAKWWYVTYPEHIVFPSNKYFSRFAPLRLEKVIYTYAGKNYKHSLWEVFRAGLSGLRRRNYNAMPSIGPDHILVILQK